MRSDLTRSTSDRRYAECGNGKPRCHLAPDDGPDNPLSLCRDHLRAYRERCGIPQPEPCPACTPVPIILANGRVWHPAGAMCFACGKTTGGTVATEEHRRKAAAEMRARMLVLWREGDRGPEWTALLARCPERMRLAFERRLAAVAPKSVDGVNGVV